mmetsp:Transcript_22131/g.44546  ORF Transcript_22131/g.44546 Transcript_22131/m.44546 type:complete len:86 (-) Transcript_22131:805-1062(-)
MVPSVLACPSTHTHALTLNSLLGENARMPEKAAHVGNYPLLSPPPAKGCKLSSCLWNASCSRNLHNPRILRLNRIVPPPEKSTGS